MVSSKERLVTLILFFLPLPNLFHRFYAGNIGKGVFIVANQVLAVILIKAFPGSDTTSEFISGFGYGLVGLVILIGIIDFFQIVTGTYTDGEGQTIVNWSNRNN